MSRKKGKTVLEHYGAGFNYRAASDLLHRKWKLGMVFWLRGEATKDKKKGKDIDGTLLRKL